MTSQSTNDDINGGPYAIYRSFTTFGENSLQTQFAYFQERIEIEAQYASALDRLAKKTFPILKEGEGAVRTSTEAWRRVYESTTALAMNHQKLVYNIDWVMDTLNKALDRQKQIMKDIRAEVKLLLREFHELKTSSVPKLKLAYYKKCEQYDAELKQSDASNPKVVKLGKEVIAADQGYRLGLIRLEEIRQKVIKARERAFIMGEGAEKDRVESVRKALVRYGEIETSVSKVRNEDTNAFALFVECIKSDVDIALYSSEFAKSWPSPTKSAYENYRVHQPVFSNLISIKSIDLVYGIPLSQIMADFPDEMAHPILASCIKCIEERGLDVEQIYAKTAKSSDVEVLKVLLEVDQAAVDWNQYDPVTISSVVKAFLRALPEPLFTFPIRDRIEYSVISDEKERSVKLKTRVRSLKKANQNLLHFLVNHFSKLLERSEFNRLSIPSLSIVFGPILFQSSIDNSEPASTGLGWFSKQQAPNVSQEAMQMEQLRLDKTLSDLIQFKEQIFEKLAVTTKAQQEQISETPAVQTEPETLNLSPTPTQNSAAPVTSIASATTSDKQISSETPLSTESSRPHLPPRTSETDFSYVPSTELPADVIPRDFANIPEDNAVLEIKPEIKPELEEAVW